MWACFQCKTRPSLVWFPCLKESWNFDMNFCWFAFMSNNHKSTQYKMFKSFRGKTKSIWVGLQVWRVFMPKVLKIWLEHFWVVLLEKNNKITENYVRKVWVQNLIILGWFQLRLVFVLEVMKYWPKLFWVVLMENNKKWTEKDVGMFRVQN